MVSSISREYVNMCLTGLPFRFRWALNQVFSSRLWLHSHHSKLSSPKSEANIQTFQYQLPDVEPVAQSGSGNGTLFCGKDLGHPLIPDEKKVTNDFTINELGEVTIITGSNMA